MSNFFSDVAEGIDNVQEEYLGPTHNYADDLYSPEEMGMTSEGTMSALSNDILGMVCYTNVLISGKCNGGCCGQKQNTPLGNKFFLKTGGMCKPDDGIPKERWLYINNVPTGNILGTTLPEFRGLVPGTIENIGHLNPLALFGGLTQGTTPPCRVLNLEEKVGGTVNTVKHVADSDIRNLDACLFDDNINPVSKKEGKNCDSGFKNMNDIMNGNKKTFDGDTSQNRPISKIYNAGFSILLVYLMYHLISKSGN
jgi:hypothetical protein